MADRYKVRTIGSVQIRIPGHKHPELIRAGSEIDIAPEDFSWRAMKPIGWDPATTKGVPPKPVAESVSFIKPRNRLAKEIVAEMKEAGARPKGKPGASGAADEG